MTRTIHALTLAALLLTGAIFPRSAGAVCDIRCYCADLGCSCGKGGRGGSCRNDGDGCMVYRCGVTPVTMMAVGADGRLARLDPGNKGTASTKVVSYGRVLHWRKGADGHMVGRGCDGAVTAEYYEAAAADRVRARTAALSI